MNHRAIIPAMLVCCGLALSGCGTFTNPGAPDQSFNVDEDIQDIEKVFKQGITIEEFYKKETDAVTGKESFPNKTKENRNEFIVGRLTLINIQYIKFIRRFAVEKAQLDTAADILVIGLGSAGTLVGAASTKAILAAISTGTSSSRTSINKNFFQEKTVPVLITAMNAERKKTLAPILEGTGKSLDEYPFATALSDLHIYYQAGTFIGALQIIQKDSGAKESKADEKLLKILADQTFGPGVNTDRIEKYLGWDDTQAKFTNAANVEKLEAWKKLNNISVIRNTSFLYADEWTSLRAKAVEDLNIQ